MGALTPRAEAQQLHPAVVWVWRLLAGAVAVPVVVAALLVASVTGAVWAWAGAVLAIVAAAVGIVWWPREAYRRFSWGVSDGVLRIRRGIVLRTEASVPAFRIQHIDVTEGPLDRWAGLQHLVVHTAAPAADLELPGIGASAAPAVRAELLALAREQAAAIDAGEAIDAV